MLALLGVQRRRQDDGRPRRVRAGPPDRAARCCFEGDDVIGQAPAVRASRGVGIVHAPEGRSVFASLTVEENLALGVPARVRAARASDRALARAYELFPRLGERRSRSPGTLSGGEQRMLSLARVLVHPPRLLVADELSLGLAPIVVDEVYRNLAAVRDAGTDAAPRRAVRRPRAADRRRRRGARQGRGRVRRPRRRARRHRPVRALTRRHACEPDTSVIVCAAAVPGGAAKGVGPCGGRGAARAEALVEDARGRPGRRRGHRAHGVHRRRQRRERREQAALRLRPLGTVHQHLRPSEVHR